jgi:hypothetical protein
LLVGWRREMPTVTGRIDGVDIWRQKAGPNGPFEALAAVSAAC